MTDAVTDPVGPACPVVDAHVHLLPERLTEAIRANIRSRVGWEFPHPTDPVNLEAALLAEGVERYVSLPYVHEPGMAADLNDWVLEWASHSEACIPFATVHAEDDVADVVESAFEAGARGLKFQCVVQETAPDDPRLDPAYELAAEYDRPITFHAGTAPNARDSPHVGVDRFERFLESYPDVRAACAHMGTFEWRAFVDLLAAYDNAYLDTSFAMSARTPEYVDFDPSDVPDSVLNRHSDRIMYGSDYPQLPHEYAVERAHLLDRDLPAPTTRDLFYRTAERFLGERD